MEVYASCFCIPLFLIKRHMLCLIGAAAGGYFTEEAFETVDEYNSKGILFVGGWISI